VIDRASQYISIVTDRASQFYQHSETNVMHLLFSLLRIKSLYVFRALFAYPQEALHKRHLVYCVRGMYVGCTSIESVCVFVYIYVMLTVVLVVKYIKSW
jgi:hypothetical protein